MNDCDDCERLPLNEYPVADLVREIDNSMSFGELKEIDITILEEITREWREQHG